jgi:hypothetical protein
MSDMYHPANGQLTQDPTHGWVWTTRCRKCGTEQRIRLGAIPVESAREAVALLNTQPGECPLGFHVELSGWRQMWSLDLMLEQYAALPVAAPAELVTV